MRSYIAVELLRSVNRIEMSRTLIPSEPRMVSPPKAWRKVWEVNRRRPETWWMSARTWAKTADKARLGQTLAGLHSDYILFILDESGGIPDAVMASAEAALSSCVEGHIVQALHTLTAFDGNYPVVGAWIVGEDPAGVGIREDNSRVTKNLSRFVPHVIVG